jgi:hypothetical protein
MVISRPASRSTIHGTFVSARAPVIGPATPNPAASMSWGSVAVSRRKCEHGHEIGKVERAVRPNLTVGAPSRAKDKKDFGSADVACEQRPLIVRP